MTTHRVTALIAIALALVGCASSGSRYVRVRQLTSPTAPAARMEVAEGFSYLGKVGYSLDGPFEGERFVFADAEGLRLRRLLVVQFERVKRDSVSTVYHYDLAPGEPIGPLRFISNTFAFAGAQAIVTPKDEADRTNNFLLARGYAMPPVWLVTRYVTLGAEDRKSEMIVFYMEGHEDVTMADLYAGEDATPRWQAMKPEVAARARASFTLE